MQKSSIFKQSHWRWVVATVAILAVIGAATFTFLGNGTSASAAHASPKTVTVWLQATDSCMEALPGAAFIVNGSGIVNRVTGTTPGTLPVGVPTYVHGHCPVDRGTCVKSTTGCITAVLNVPATGTATYTITPRVIAGKHIWMA